jgi:hypothetical protein
LYVQGRIQPPTPARDSIENGFPSGSLPSQTSMPGAGERGALMATPRDSSSDRLAAKSLVKKTILGESSPMRRGPPP